MLLHLVRDRLPTVRWVLFAVIVGCFTIRLALSIPGNSITFDEPVHLTRGYAALRLRDLRLNVEHPVLGDAIAAIPAALIPSVHFPRNSPAWRDAAHWELADEFLWHSGNRAQFLVDLARGMVALLSICLALLVFVWSRGLYGWGGGLLALLLYTLCPTVLANSILATNDLALALFSTLFLWTLFLYVQAPTAKNAAVAGLSLGLALLCKYSSLVLVIDFILLLGLEYRRRRINGDVPLPARQSVGVLAAAALVVWASCGFWVGSMANPRVMHQEVGEVLDAFVQGGGREPDSQVILPGVPIRLVGAEQHNARWQFLHRVPLPAPQYLRGLLQNLMQARGGHRAFLHGKVSSSGWWYYFIAALLLKTPIPFLLIILLALASARASWRFEESFLLVPAAVLFLVAMKSHIDIGIRHILPMLPLLAIYCGRLIPTIRSLPGEGAGWTQRKAFTGLGVLLAWFAIEGAAIHPLYLTYFNELAGGPSGGHRYLVDSNLDWGQDLIRLQAALRRHDPPIGTVGLAYFGSAEPGAYGLDYVPLDVSPGQKAAPGQAPIYGWIAASESCLAYYGGPGGGLDWLRYFKPQFKVAHTFRVYHIPLPAVKRPDIRWLRHSDQMLE